MISCWHEKQKVGYVVGHVYYWLCGLKKNGHNLFICRSCGKNGYVVGMKDRKLLVLLLVMWRRKIRRNNGYVVGHVFLLVKGVEKSGYNLIIC